ncbi:MAG: DUF1579 family protein [Planctomycetes bacterium]|nr:DUF1579 family protein [Planctomycetota bacterium]
MHRVSYFGILGLVTLGACAAPPMGDPFAKPTPPAELKKLDKFAGKWTGTWEMVEPTVEEMNKMMPEGSKPMPAVMKGESKGDWTLGGMYLHRTGSYEMPGDQKSQFAEIMTWDAKAKKYRSWFFSDMGEYGEGTMTLDKDGKTYRMKFKGTDGHGHAMHGQGTMTAVDDNTMEGSMTMTGCMGTWKMKGTEKRAK